MTDYIGLNVENLNNSGWPEIDVDNECIFGNGVKYFYSFD